jgi:O-antigen/teichoic acid export membrane protein
VVRPLSWRRGLAVLVAGESFSRVLSFFAIWLLTQRLGRDAYAPVAVVLATMMFLSLAVEMGLPLFGAREVARDPSAAARLLPRALGMQLAVASVLVLAAFFVSMSGLVVPDIARLLPGYAVSLLLLPWLAPWIFQGFGAMQWVAAPAVLRQALFLAGSALLVRSTVDLARLPWVEVAAVGGAALLAQAALRRRGVRVRVDPRGAADRELLHDAVPMGSSQLTWVLRMYLATLILWTVVPKESVSNYDVAHRVMMVMQGMLSMYFTNVYPAIARAASGAAAGLRRLLWRSTLLLGAATLTGAVAIAVAALPLLQTLFPRGNYANAESAICLVLLAFVIPVLAVRGHARLGLLATGFGRLELACSVAGTLVLAGLTPWWASTRGAAGAAQALLCAEIAGAVITLVALGFVLWATPRHERVVAPAAGAAGIET